MSAKSRFDYRRERWGEGHAADRVEVAVWAANLAPWTDFFTGTFGREVSCDQAVHGFVSFIHKFPQLSYFYAVEPNPSGYGHHVHALLCDVPDAARPRLKATWFGRFGTVELQGVRNLNDAADYVTTTVLHNRGWYDLKLRTHHWLEHKNSPPPVSRS